MREHAIDLVVLGTHRRTGAEKFLLSSVAVEIFRLSAVPVLTIGPGVRDGAHSGGRFHSVLFAQPTSRPTLRLPRLTRSRWPRRMMRVSFCCMLCAA